MERFRWGQVAPLRTARPPRLFIFWLPSRRPEKTGPMYANILWIACSGAGEVDASHLWLHRSPIQPRRSPTYWLPAQPDASLKVENLYLNNNIYSTFVFKEQYCTCSVDKQTTILFNSNSNIWINFGTGTRAFATHKWRAPSTRTSCPPGSALYKKRFQMRSNALENMPRCLPFSDTLDLHMVSGIMLDLRLILHMGNSKRTIMYESLTHYHKLCQYIWIVQYLQTFYAITFKALNNFERAYILLF